MLVSSNFYLQNFKMFPFQETPAIPRTPIAVSVAATGSPAQQANPQTADLLRSLGITDVTTNRGMSDS